MNFDWQGVIDLLDQFYLIIIGLSGICALYYGARGWIGLKVAGQMGGMNSMGTRSFISEALVNLLACYLFASLAWVIGAISDELVGVTFAWDSANESQAGQYLAGTVVIKIIQLIGVYTIFNTFFGLVDKNGGAKISTTILRLLMGVGFVGIEWINNELSKNTGVNPLALFLPGSSVLSI
jgi:hypothetical protein